MPWNSNLAYAIGFIATDGCLYTDGRHLELTSKDMEQLTVFKRCLNLKNKIGWKGSGYSKKRYPRVQFGNVKFYRWLVEIGLMPCKSKKLGALNISDDYFFDFLRGCLDGDGCIRTFMDPVYPNARRLYVSFSSASRTFLEWMHWRVSKPIEVPGFIRMSTRAFQSTYAKKASLTLLKALYYRSDIPCLQRKCLIAESFL